MPLEVWNFVGSACHVSLADAHVVLGGDRKAHPLKTWQVLSSKSCHAGRRQVYGELQCHVASDAGLQTQEGLLD